MVDGFLLLFASNVLYRRFYFLFRIVSLLLMIMSGMIFKRYGMKTIVLIVYIFISMSKPHLAIHYYVQKSFGILTAKGPEDSKDLGKFGVTNRFSPLTC